MTRPGKASISHRCTSGAWRRAWRRVCTLSRRRTNAVHASQGGAPTMSPSAIVRQVTIWPAALFVVMFWAFVTPAHATTIFTATLSGANEVPPNASPATGTATAILSDDQLTLAVTESFSGLVGGGAAAAHI